MLTSLNDVFRRKPAWVKREISRPEAAILARRIRATGAVRGAEVGVAGGGLLDPVRPRSGPHQLIGHDLHRTGQIYRRIGLISRNGDHGVAAVEFFIGKSGALLAKNQRHGALGSSGNHLFRAIGRVQRRPTYAP